VLTVGHDADEANGNDGGRRSLLDAPMPLRTSADATRRAPQTNPRRSDPNTGERQRFYPAFLPAWARNSPFHGDRACRLDASYDLLRQSGILQGSWAPAED